MLNPSGVGTTSTPEIQVLEEAAMSGDTRLGLGGEERDSDLAAVQVGRCAW